MGANWDRDKGRRNDIVNSHQGQPMLLVFTLYEESWVNSSKLLGLYQIEIPLLAQHCNAEAGVVSIGCEAFQLLLVKYCRQSRPGETGKAFQQGRNVTLRPGNGSEM